MCAWTAKLKGNDVRIAISKVDKGKNIDHAQAEVKIGGKWIPLTNLWNDKIGQTVETWTRHYPDIEPYRYVPLNDFVREQSGGIK